MIGGRNLAASNRAATMRVEMDGVEVDSASIPPGFFLRTVSLPSLAGSGAYAAIRIASDTVDLAIEQFDAQPAGVVMSGFGEGWYEAEYNPATGQQWRWASDKATLRVRNEARAVALTLRGELEEASSSHLVVRAGDRVVAEFDVDRTFQRTIVIPAEAFAAPETALVIESSAFYVPAEARWRSADRRRLALKLYECRVAAAS
jgi:hypothetical protein